jgi:hypothetical protein
MKELAQQPAGLRDPSTGKMTETRAFRRYLESAGAI